MGRAAPPLALRVYDALVSAESTQPLQPEMVVRRATMNFTGPRRVVITFQLGS
jgi:hypothetical protein